MNKNCRCYYDFVTAYEGPTINSSTLLATFCGNLSHNLPIVKSERNIMTLVFNSDSSQADEGFVATVIKFDIEIIWQFTNSYLHSRSCSSIVHRTVVEGPLKWRNLTHSALNQVQLTNQWTIVTGFLKLILVDFWPSISKAWTWKITLITVLLAPATFWRYSSGKSQKYKFRLWPFREWLPDSWWKWTILGTNGSILRKFLTKYVVIFDQLHVGQIILRWHFWGFWSCCCDKQYWM